jgi:peroxin-3
MPTLGQQILRDMDVEGVTHELQAKSKAIKFSSQHSPPAASSSSLASSIEIVQDHGSDAGSMSVSSNTGSVADSNLAESSQSWVEQFSSGPSRESSSEARPRSMEIGSLLFLPGADLSDSFTTTSSGYSNGKEHPGRVSMLHLILNLRSLTMQFYQLGVTGSVSSDASSKSKAELWKEVKILSK